MWSQAGLALCAWRSLRQAVGQQPSVLLGAWHATGLVPGYASYGTTPGDQAPVGKPGKGQPRTAAAQQAERPPVKKAAAGAAARNSPVRRAPPQTGPSAAAASAGGSSGGSGAAARWHSAAAQALQAPLWQDRMAALEALLAANAPLEDKDRGSLAQALLGTCVQVPPGASASPDQLLRVLAAATRLRSSPLGLDVVMAAMQPHLHSLAIPQMATLLAYCANHAQLSQRALNNTLQPAMRALELRFTQARPAELADAAQRFAAEPYIGGADGGLHGVRLKAWVYRALAQRVLGHLRSWERQGALAGRDGPPFSAQQLAALLVGYARSRQSWGSHAELMGSLTAAVQRAMADLELPALCELSWAYSLLLKGQPRQPPPDNLPALLAALTAATTNRLNALASSLQAAAAAAAFADGSGPREAARSRSLWQANAGLPAAPSTSAATGLSAAAAPQPQPAAARLWWQRLPWGSGGVENMADMHASLAWMSSSLAKLPAAHGRDALLQALAAVVQPQLSAWPARHLITVLSSCAKLEHWDAALWLPALQQLLPSIAALPQADLLVLITAASTYTSQPCHKQTGQLLAHAVLLDELYARLSQAVQGARSRLSDSERAWVNFALARSGFSPPELGEQLLQEASSDLSRYSMPVLANIVAALASSRRGTLRRRGAPENAALGALLPRLAAELQHRMGQCSAVDVAMLARSMGTLGWLNKEWFIALGNRAAQLAQGMGVQEAVAVLTGFRTANVHHLPLLEALAQRLAGAAPGELRLAQLPAVLQACIAFDFVDPRLLEAVAEAALAEQDGWEQDPAQALEVMHKLWQLGHSQPGVYEAAAALLARQGRQLSSSQLLMALEPLADAGHARPPLLTAAATALRGQVMRSAADVEVAARGVALLQRARHHDAQLLDALAADLAALPPAKLRSVRSSALNSLLRAWASAGNYHPQLYRQIGELLMGRMEQLTLLQLASINHCFRTMASHPQADAALHGEVQRLTAAAVFVDTNEAAQQLTDGDLAQLLTDLRASNLYNPAWFDRLAEGIGWRVSDFPPAVATAVASTYAWFGHFPADLFGELECSVLEEGRLETFSLPQRYQLLAAFVAADAASSSFLLRSFWRPVAALAASFSPHMQHMAPEHITAVVQQLSRHGTMPEEVLAGLAGSLRSRGGGYSASELAALVTALQPLGSLARGELLEPLLAALLARPLAVSCLELPLQQELVSLAARLPRVLQLQQLVMANTHGKGGARQWQQQQHASAAPAADRALQPSPANDGGSAPSSR